MPEESDEFVKRLASALMGRDAHAMSGMFASWLQADEAQSQVESVEASTREEWDDVDIGTADGYDIDGNPMTAAELRDEGVALPAEIDDDNFHGWWCITVRADDGEWSLYDFWFALVSENGSVKIGYYEVTDPD